MTRSGPYRRNTWSVSPSFTNKLQTTKRVALTGALLASFACFAQEQSQSGYGADSTQPQRDMQDSSVTIAAGTRLALVLTQPVQSRNVRRGDDVYAQVMSPVNDGSQVVIPPGTFVQGTVDKVDRKGGRGEIHLQSMSVTFPDGYVTSIAGPMTLESDEGYALKDPGKGRAIGAFALPAAGAGLGAVIGHSINSSPTTITSSLPPGCTGPPPGCLSSSLTGPSNAGRNAVIGAGIGGMAGAIGSIALLVGGHHFYLDVGSPVEMRLPQSVSLSRKEVSRAVEQSQEHPVQQAVAARPLPPVDAPTDHGTCYTPGTPGTPDTVIPGAPGTNGVPGPPTVIPGTPATPGTAYPCP
jgi:hypothetical protein